MIHEQFTLSSPQNEVVPGFPTAQRASGVAKVAGSEVSYALSFLADWKEPTRVRCGLD
jgi:hypothetical protein